MEPLYRVILHRGKSTRPPLQDLTEVGKWKITLLKIS